MNLLDKYHRLVLNTQPSKSWKRIRFVIHWVTLPIKVALIGGLGITQIILKSFKKARPVQPFNQQKEYLAKKDFQKVFNLLPILKGDETELYVNRVPFGEPINGSNHNTDHQTSRQGTYVFLKRKLGLDTEAAENALALHMWRKWLKRGFKQNSAGETVDNISSTSGDMLVGLCLGMLDTTNYGLRDRYYELIHSIIDNDYALLAHDIPEKDEAGYEYYMERYNATGENPNNVNIKSYKARWEPGLDVVGAQALTLLAALRIGDKVLMAQDAKKEYKKMLFKYGYGLLSLFPTAYIDSKRGYFNDHNCIVSLYILSKLADSRMGKLFWKCAMVYVWALSRHWYNGYFTGLVNDAHPNTINESYINKCKAYLYEFAPRSFNYAEGTSSKISKLEPGPFILMNEDEFAPDRDMNKIVTEPPYNYVYGGLGFVAHAVMLEKDPTKLNE